MKTRNLIQSKEIREEILTPKEFIKVYKTGKNVIKDSSILPAKLGQLGFGKIRVTYKTPIFGPVLKKNRYTDGRSK